MSAPAVPAANPGSVLLARPRPEGALDRDFVYFTVAGGTALARAPKAGGAQRILLTGLTTARGLLLDEQSAYLLEHDKPDTAECSARLLRLPKEGGRPTTLAKVPCGAQTASTDAAIWVGYRGGQLTRIAKDGGGTTRVPLQVAGGLAGLAGQGDTLFFSSGDRIYSMGEQGTVPSVVCSGLRYPASAIAVAPDALYFVDAHDDHGSERGSFFALRLAH